MDPNPNRSIRGRYRTKHGLTNHKWYPLWRAMMDRCYNEKSDSFAGYGERGIRVCEEWQTPKAFIEWLERNGHKKGLQIDRIDNDGDYSPSNCRLITRSVNCRNRRDSVRYSVRGEILLAIEVEERYGVPYHTFRARVERYGLTPDEAVSKPMRTRMPSKYLVDGKHLTPTEIEDQYGVKKSTFSTRIRRGWSIERAVRKVRSSVGG